MTKWNIILVISRKEAGCMIGGRCLRRDQAPRRAQAPPRIFMTSRWLSLLKPLLLCLRQAQAQVDIRWTLGGWACWSYTKQIEKLEFYLLKFPLYKLFSKEKLLIIFEQVHLCYPNILLVDLHLEIINRIRTGSENRILSYLLQVIKIELCYL